MDNQKLASIVNQSGFPFQIGVASLIEKTFNQHRWKVLFSEHSWKNELDNASGFVDMVLEDGNGTSVMIVECKRVLDSSWIFLNPNFNSTNTSHAKAWITSYENESFKHFYWADIALSPSSVESGYCVIPGQDAKSKPMLERVAADLVSATEAIALEEKDYQVQQGRAFRMYFSVIVTTAKLNVCKFDPEQVSLIDGKVADQIFTEVPFVRFRKQLSNQTPHISPNFRDGLNDLVRAKEHTVFVVNSEAVPEFLQGFDVNNQSIRRF
jgi:hypothetical protein